MNEPTQTNLKFCIDCPQHPLQYEVGLQKQSEYQEAVFQNKIEGALILLEHESTITIGMKPSNQNILLNPTLLTKLNIPVYKTNRGGDVTYHGPGQLVGYPVISLRKRKLKVRDYIHMLEMSLMELLTQYQINSIQHPNATGVWINDKTKIASIGVHISRGITTHGFALNINNDLTPFTYINPCGFTDIKLTSMEHIIGKKLNLNEVRVAYTKLFCQMFNISSFQ